MPRMKTNPQACISFATCLLTLVAAFGCSDADVVPRDDTSGSGGDVDVAPDDDENGNGGIGGSGGDGGQSMNDGGGGVSYVAHFDICDGQQQVEHGTLCAIQPSKTDATIRDFNGTVDAPGTGFGYHVVAVPQTSPPTGIWVHFGGSFGSPYLPGSDNYASDVWLDELLGEGYLVIQVAYSNPNSISGQICGPTTPGYAVDNCAGDVRREVLEGIDASSEVDVPMQDGVTHRIDRLLAYLTASGWTLPGLDTGVDWPSWRVSGHSQGAGNAYYLARNEGVQFACHLGGPYDFPDAVAPQGAPIADWYLAGESATPVDRLGAFVVTSDDGYNGFVGAYGVMGMEPDVHWFEATGEFTNDVGELVDGHAASLASPELAPQRALACFR